jgi:hypothetical protein
MTKGWLLQAAQDTTAFTQMAVRCTDLARRVANAPVSGCRYPGLIRRDQVPWTTKRVPGTGACAAIYDQDSAVHVVVSGRHAPHGKPAIYV